ncbi:hypothetical protein XELAEV_18031466mg [Xenopus laevis]|uniref:Uncharacterized protein n=1 Tax=Xenopus laevis TaxID=8355 RepID=A0A974CQ05_XENLA|nr:hypothetical protein XELAEV_18031466mg [Xenopus laevis]
MCTLQVFLSLCTLCKLFLFSFVQLLCTQPFNRARVYPEGKKILLNERIIFHSICTDLQPLLRLLISHYSINN